MRGPSCLLCLGILRGSLDSRYIILHWIFWSGKISRYFFYHLCYEINFGITYLYYILQKKIPSNERLQKMYNKEILCLVVKSYESNALLFFNLVVPGPICFGTQVFKVHGIENTIFVCQIIIVVFKICLLSTSRPIHNCIF